MVRVRRRVVPLAIAFGLGLSLAEDCQTPGRLLSVTGTPKALWATNRQLEVVRIPDGAEVAYHVFGDEVILSRDLPELVRPVGTTATKVSRVKIDARVVVIDDRLSLSDASLIIQAHTVTFTPRGVIVFPIPPKERPQSLNLTAAVLDLSKAKRTPLLMATRDWTPAGAWPQSGQSGRTISVRVGTLRPHPQAPSGPDWLRWYTLDRGQSATEQNWRDAYSVAVGSEGARAWRQQALSDQRWPQYYLNRVLATYAQAPYDPGMRRFVEERLHLLDFLSDRRTNVVYPQLVQARATLSRGIDLFGQSEAAVPLLDVQKQLQAMSDAMDRDVYGTPTQPALLAVWDAEWVRSLKASNLDVSLIQKTQAQFEDRWKEIDSLERRIGTEFTQLAASQARAAQTQLRVNSRLDTLKREWEQRVKAANGDANAIKVAQTVTVVAGALYPPAAPVAATVAQGLDVVAEGVCGAVQGKTGFGAAFAAIEATSARRGQLDKALSEARTAYTAQKAAKAGARRYLAGDGNESDRQAFGSFTSSVGQWATATGKAVQALRGGGCGDQAVPQFDQDQTLRTYLGELEAEQTTQAAVLARLSGMQVQQQTLTLETVSLQTALKDLQTLTLGNEVARLQAAQLSGVVRQQLYGRLLQRLAQLRRALVAAGVEPAAIPQALWLSPLAMSIDWKADNWGRSQEQWEEVLSARRTALGRYLKTFLAFAEDELKGLDARVLNGAFVPIQFYAGPHSTGGTDAAPKMDFLAAVNRSLLEVYRQGQQGVRQVHVPVRIPFDVVATGQPEYFVDAVVRAASFKPERSDLEIVFEVHNAGAGRLYFPGRCVRVVSDGSSLVKARSTTVASSNPTVLWSDRIDSVMRSKGLLQQSVPFDADYYLTVSLPQPRSWPAAPQVRDLRIDFVKRGPQLP